jgi:hypothetical protein
MDFNEYLASLPLLHSWDGGTTWNTGGFDRHQLEALYSCLKSELPLNPVLLETGAGNSTITLSYLKPDKLITICPDPELIGRITLFCSQNGIPINFIDFHEDYSQWMLPKLASEFRNLDPILDFALIDGCHGWPTCFIDLEYIHFLLRKSAMLMIDDLQLYSISEMTKFLLEQAGYYQVVLDLGKALILKKTTSDRSFGEWTKQPYITRMTEGLGRKADRPSDSLIFENLDLETVGLRRLVSSSLAMLYARIVK